MSGDTQPKKRKDKKRKKDDEDTVKETTVHAPKQPSAGAAQAAKEPGDIQMHIHSDHGTGGHWCAKVVFFILLAGLGALIGLILMESQGVSNDDTPLSESRYSEFFNGWVDETRQDEHHHDEILAAINSLDDHDESEAQHAVDEHDDGDDDGHDQDGDDEHDDGAPYAEEEDHDDDEEGTDVQDDDEDEGPAQKLDDDEVEEIFTQQEAGAQQEAAAAAEDDDNDDDEDEDEDGDGQDDDDDDEDGANDNTNVVVDDNDDDDDGGDDDKNEDTTDVQDNDDDNDEDDKNDNDQDGADDNDGKEDVDGDDDVLTNIKPEKNDDNDNDEDEEDENVTAATEKDGEDDDDDDDFEVDNEESNAESAVKTNAAGNANVADVDDDDDDDQDDTLFDEDQSNALNDSSNQSLPAPLERSFTEGDILKRSAQNSRISEADDPARKQASSPTTPSADETVTGDTLKDQMDELVRNYNKLAESLNVPKVEVQEAVGVQDADDDGDEAEIEEVTRGSQPANDDDDEAFGELVDNDEGEEEYLEKVRTEQQRRAAAEEERRAAAEPVEESSQIPSRAEEADRSYQEELRRAEQQLDEGKPQEALAIFDRIILGKPKSIAALVGRARCLDALAEQRRSNAILTEAITAYRKVIEQELAVDDATFKTVAERCIDRMRFQGQHAKAIDVHKALIRRFDNEPQYRNQLAVSYLYMNRLAEAKAVLHETLLRWIDDGFALVHYGFVLKTLDQNMELAAQYLQEGIETEHPGTQDGRFYFQLGDALQRLGRNGEALNVYRKGVQKKLFLSLYQRSLYNVEGLRSRPFWTEAQTTYTTELELIRAQWQQVRDEGMKLLNSAGVFVNESENLRDRGDWKQLELFSRGARVERNCARAPLTCRLVEQYFPAARTCKRGQVKFSVMHPGTHVWPHCGPTNCRIRAHLGLSVPQGTYIRVAEETRSWENGKWLIFDDSFEHEVWHNGTETRLVLIVDFWHPELTESQRRTLSPI